MHIIVCTGIRYRPENPTYQISKLKHYEIYRTGIWNQDIISSNNTEGASVTSAGGKVNNNIVYSTSGVPLKLSDAAAAKIRHIYNGIYNVAISVNIQYIVPIL